ncbi:transketolase [Taibaiella soli]|uniref:Transketolase n=1 Tax=Taibaiella soli TaxID=1649169 RepID=A0A2W2AKA5_9BACT|nr:transketolase [Taibaiella soli]PZF72690.1 transketolase [Taibaiella soli]
MEIAEKCIDTIRCLAIDAVEHANSGHPGAPMALAPAAYVLWMKHLRYNPRNPNWFNRDRFILSNGHASMLQYAVLHLTGYDITLDDIKQFRQLGSITPGHPEHGLTPGVETTTGPLGQGFMTAVGMAMAEAHLAKLFNKDDTTIVDHYTYVFCSDGDLMEGASHEAASIAGHLGLGKLIYLYDNNHITIEGNTNLTYDDDVARRFEAYNWHVQDIGDVANDLEAISTAFQKAKDVKDKPSLIMLRTHIGYGSPNKQDTSAAHGSPLGDEEVRLTKKFYGWPEDKTFYVPDDVKEHMAHAVVSGNKLEKEWDAALAAYKLKYADPGIRFEQYLKQEPEDGWDNDMPVYKSADGEKATRSVTTDVTSKLATSLPWLIGGSADLGESTSSFMKSLGYYSKDAYQDRNIAWGIREHAMCAASTGLMVHGGVRPFAATYFCFTDYAKPAIRMAAIMEQPVIYVMTHDSIGLGEDGKTHQPIEQLITFRAMPNIVVLRPADANETVQAWLTAIKRKEGPTMLVLTRQKVAVIDQDKYTPAKALERGAYILSKEAADKPDAIIIATGSEVQLAIAAQNKLLEQSIAVRVVSMPSWELFRKQSKAYRDEVLPPAITTRLAVEAAAPEGWHEWVGSEGQILGMTDFGASAPAKDLFQHFGFTADNIVAKIKTMISGK